MLGRASSSVDRSVVMNIVCMGDGILGMKWREPFALIAGGEERAQVPL